jgi:hypothetical protein
MTCSMRPAPPAAARWCCWLRGWAPRSTAYLAEVEEALRDWCQTEPWEWTGGRGAVGSGHGDGQWGLVLGTAQVAGLTVQPVGAETTPRTARRAG